MIKDYLEMSSNDISKLSINDLKTIYMEIRSEIIKKYKSNCTAKDLEILYCYIVKEIETRGWHARASILKK